LHDRSVAQFFDPAKGMFLPIATSGHLPQVRYRAGPVRRQLRALWCHYAPTDLRSRSFCRRRGTSRLRALLFEVRSIQDFLRRGSEDVSPCPGSGQKLAEWRTETGFAHGSYFARRAYSVFGIPGAPRQNISMWLDAPIGYLNNFKTLCGQRIGFESTCVPRTRPNTISSRDIVNFHGLFWPYVLEGVGLRAPTPARHTSPSRARCPGESRGTFVIFGPTSGLEPTFALLLRPNPLAAWTAWT
jgi:methionyl-tRNA synthetase